MGYGWNEFPEKMKKVNSQTARVGCVAVISTSSVWGHVALVSGVNGSTITIDEGNWNGRCNTRSGSK